MRIELPYPHKALWPNGRAHWAAKGNETKKHRAWAKHAALAQRPQFSTVKLRLKITVHPKPKGPLPDRDNCIAAAKSYQDGIADAINGDDKYFAAPTIEFGEPRNGTFVIDVEEWPTAAEPFFPYPHRSLAEVG